MSDQIKKWCDAIMFHEDDLELGTCKTLKMITDEAARLTSELYKARKETAREIYFLIESAVTSVSVYPTVQSAKAATDFKAEIMEKICARFGLEE